MRWTTLLISVVLAGVLTVDSMAQSSSLLYTPPANSTRSTVASSAEAMGYTAQANVSAFDAMPPKDNILPMTRALERISLTAIPSIPPRKFKTQDLITIIVRQQKKYESEAKLDTEKKWNIDAELKKWFRFFPGNNLGEDKLTNGKPGFDFGMGNKYEADGESEREDKYTTRITAHIIDVKPNGNLVLEASSKEQHDEEVICITMTGMCRSGDVTPDNTILSSQLAEVDIKEWHEGAVRDATKRGWIPRIMDWLRPF